MKRTEVLFVMARLPSGDSDGHMYVDLMKEFRKAGCAVKVIAIARPTQRTGVYIEGDLEILRVNIPPLGWLGFIGKGIREALLPILYRLSLRRYPRFLSADLIIATTPPVSLGGVIKYIKAKTRSEAYLILRDFVAQAAVELKLIKGGGLSHRWLQSRERTLLEACEFIGCMSAANVDYANKLYPAEAVGKCHVLVNFLGETQRLQASEEVQRLLGITGMFVLVFGGNMGRPQQLEHLLEVAAECADLTDVVFLFYGDGTEKRRLRLAVKTRKLANVRINDPIDKQSYNELLANASLGLVSLSGSLTVPCHPSKIVGYIAQGLPVLASVNGQNDLGAVMESEGWGVATAAGNVSEMVSLLREIYADRGRLSRMRWAAAESFRERYSTGIACRRILAASGLVEGQNKSEVQTV